MKLLEIVRRSCCPHHPFPEHGGTISFPHYDMPTLTPMKPSGKLYFLVIKETIIPLALLTLVQQ